MTNVIKIKLNVNTGLWVTGHMLTPIMLHHQSDEKLSALRDNITV